MSTSRSASLSRRSSPNRSRAATPEPARGEPSQSVSPPRTTPATDTENYRISGMELAEKYLSLSRQGTDPRAPATLLNAPERDLCAEGLAHSGLPHLSAPLPGWNLSPSMSRGTYHQRQELSPHPSLQRLDSAAGVTPGQFYSLPRGGSRPTSVVVRTLDRQELSTLKRVVAGDKGAAASLPRGTGTAAGGPPLTPGLGGAAAFSGPDLHDGDRIVITKSQLAELAPAMPTQSGMRQVLGVRPLSGAQSDVMELDLDTFIPLVQLLNAAPTASSTVGTNSIRSNARSSQMAPLVSTQAQKVAVLHQLLLADRGPELDRNVMHNLVGDALKDNGLVISPRDQELLASHLLSRLDVDGDGVVSATDFALATRSWNLAKIGLPLARGGGTANADIFADEYLAVAVDAAADESDIASAVGLRRPTSAGGGSTVLGPMTSRRRSRVQGAGEWLMHRSSRLWESMPNLAEATTESQDDEIGLSGDGDFPPKPRQSSDGLTRHPTMARRRASAAAALAGTQASGQHQQKQQQQKDAPPRRLTPLQSYLKLEGAKLFCVFIYIVACAALFVYQFNAFASNPVLLGHFGYWVPVAKGSAHVIMLSVALMLLLMCRNLLTIMRNVPGLSWIPGNKHIVWHRWAGFIVMFFSAVHTVCHVVGSMIVLANDPAARALAKLPTAPGAVTYWDLMFLSIPGATGWVLVAVFVLMTVTALVRFRRPHFELFWYTHHLFVVALAMLFLHGAAALLSKPSAWKYLTVPTALYLGERILRVVRSRSPASLIHARIQADTIQLVFTKPAWVHDYASGQYVFINVPSLSRLQWHPFTLTSSPRDPYMSLRVKRAGDWTKALFETMAPFAESLAEAQRSQVGTSPVDDHRSSVRVLMRASLPTVAAPEICIDGPFSAASEEFFDYNRVMFIATGVGATPFLSILKQIEHQIQAQDDESDDEDEDDDDDDDEEKKLERSERAQYGSSTRIDRVDFYWINRDQAGFKWMSEILRAADPRVRRVLRVHTFLTCTKGTSEITSFMLWWGLEMLKRGPLRGRCLLTGMQHSSVYWGRPHWPSIFEQTAQMGPGKVGVFFCGPAVLSKQLYRIVRERNATQSENEPRFVFAKENF
ncbi:ferric reductase NAD binding domain-containing protein [Blastocladiella britannica]|nr:ferric reductase NAD binding domain-containing protein [Blastocladiella britannica]